VQLCRDGELVRADVTCERAFLVVDVSGQLVAHPLPERDQLVRPRLRMANLDQETLDRGEHLINLALCRSGSHAMRSSCSRAMRLELGQPRTQAKVIRWLDRRALARRQAGLCISWRNNLVAAADDVERARIERADRAGGRRRAAMGLELFHGFTIAAPADARS